MQLACARRPHAVSRAVGNVDLLCCCCLFGCSSCGRRSPTVLSGTCGAPGPRCAPSTGVGSISGPFALSRRFLLPTLCAQCAAGRHCCSTCVCHERGCLQEAQAAAENSGAEVYAKRRMHAHTLTRTPAHELSHCSCAHARTRTRTHAAPAHARARSHPPAHPVSRTRLLPDASACAPINSARRSSGCGSR